MGFRRRCCVGCLYGTFNVDTGFKADYLIELEKMLEKVLPYGMLKAKPNLESRIRTLKRDWEIVYDMLSAKNNSGFGWDEHRQLVVAEDVVLLVEKIRTVGIEISRSIAFELLIQEKSEMTIRESALKLYPTLCEVKGLTEDERYRVLSKIPDHPTQNAHFL
ncbi:hypothetical protein Godav_027794 [Gossypium davidsonii]|uniref:Myb/SANT-like domain-containing protein n=1 Tax=Gossypium davidsonii TaxID=34287 RepID=A0A7J8RXR4_GOSDV|nr:hypothetical protein [Gossypium davidsonii]